MSNSTKWSYYKTKKKCILQDKFQGEGRVLTYLVYVQKHPNFINWVYFRRNVLKSTQFWAFFKEN